MTNGASLRDLPNQHYGKSSTEYTYAAQVQWVVQLSLPRMVRGYVLSVRRLADAIDTQKTDDVFLSLFEASNWLDSLAARCKLHGNAHVEAVRFARIRTHHQWAAAVSEETGNWLWRPVSDMPRDKKGRNANEEEHYRRYLEGKPVMDVFERLHPTIAALAPEADLT